MNIRSSHLLPAAILAFLIGGSVRAQSGPLINQVGPAAPQPAATPAGKLTLDEVLDMLDKRGRSLDSFIANVKLAEADSKGFEETRIGQVWYQRLEDGQAQIRVSFTERRTERTKSVERKDYVLDNTGWLTERDEAKKIQIRRQVIKPGQKMDLFRLGDGPFPLPIGQKKEDVKKQFEASIAKPSKDDPPGSVHLLLKPRAGTALRKQFRDLDVYVDPATQMPIRIDTADDKGNSRTTSLDSVKVNVKLIVSDFELPPIKDPTWNVREEPFKE